MWTKRRRFPLGACAALALFGAFLGWRLGCVKHRPIVADWSATPLVEGSYEVVRVTGGDRLEVRRAGSPSRRVYVVRLLGVGVADHRFKAPARKWLKRRLAGDFCRLEFDKRRLDRQGAFLAYLYVGEALINEELIREGLAAVDLKPDDSAQIARRLDDAQADAIAAKRGVWAEP